MTDPPKILILTNVMPGDFGVGSIYLRDLLKDYPNEKVCFFSIEHIPTQENLQKWSCFYSKPPCGRMRFDIMTLGVSEAVLSSADRLSIWSNVFSDIIAFAHREKPDILVSVLFGTWIVRNTVIVQKALGLPLISIIWDPPGYLAHFRRRTGLGKLLLLNSFRNALYNSSAICFPSHAMSNSVPELHDVASTVLIHGVDRQLFRPPSKDNTIAPRSCFRIAFSGSMYAKENWVCLFLALDELNWRLADKPVEIVCCGNYLAFERFKRPVNLRILGYRSFSDQLDVIADSDLSYLPYWFRPEHKETAQFSFPNKLSIYLAACCPVLFHGPDYSSIPSTSHLTGLGPVCLSLDSHELASCLQQYSEMSVESYRENILELREQEFNAQVFRSRFKSIIDSVVKSNRNA